MKVVILCSYIPFWYHLYEVLWFQSAYNLTYHDKKARAATVDSFKSAKEPVLQNKMDAMGIMSMACLFLVMGFNSAIFRLISSPEMFKFVFGLCHGEGMPEKNAKNNPSAALLPFLILLAWATEEEKGPRTAHLEQELGAQSPSMCRLLEIPYGYECHSFNRPYSCNIACKYHYQNHGPHGIADPGGKRFRKYTHRQAWNWNQGKYQESGDGSMFRL